MILMAKNGHRKIHAPKDYAVTMHKSEQPFLLHVLPDKNADIKLEALVSKRSLILSYRYSLTQRQSSYKFLEQSQSITI